MMDGDAPEVRRKRGIRLTRRRDIRPSAASQAREFGADESDFRFVLCARELATHQPEAAKDEVGIHDIGFAVVADLTDAPLLEGIPDLAAVHAELAGEADQFGEVIERRIGTWLVHRQQVHQVEMARGSG